MSCLLFLDESGHDHRTTPYEVRGGIALHDSRLWPFAQDVKRLELASFGTALHQFKKELKGCKLLDKDRFRWALQASRMSDEERRKNCRGFLTKGLEKKSPRRAEFTGYGQACLEMATGIFELLRQNEARLVAAVIPRGAQKPETYEADEYLMDHVFLLERTWSGFPHGQEGWFWGAEKRAEAGLLAERLGAGLRHDLHGRLRVRRHLGRVGEGRLG